MAKEPRQTAATGTIGELAPAAERVALGTSGGALATASAVSGALAVDAGGAVADGTATAGSVAEAAAHMETTEVLREVPGPGVGAERVAERFDTVRDRSVEEVARQARLPQGVTLVNPEDVPGRRLVDVATRITHDGVDYAPDHVEPELRSVLLTFKQYSELAAIGAVIPLSSREVRFWADDED